MKKLVYLLIITGILATGCAKEIVNSKTTYVVTAIPGYFKVSFTNYNGDIERLNIAQDIWQYSFISNNGDFTSVSAQSFKDSTFLKVEIYNEGILLSSDSAYGIAPEVYTSADIP